MNQNELFFPLQLSDTEDVDAAVNPIIVYAEVKQGNNPVVGARVRQVGGQFSGGNLVDISREQLASTTAKALYMFICYTDLVQFDYGGRYNAFVDLSK